MILNIKTSTRLDEDFVAWNPDRLGCFSVRSAYQLAISLSNMDRASSSSGSSLSASWKCLWNCNIPQKVKIFAWKAASNCLPTMENKKRRKMESSDLCAMCCTESEDIAHALCRCPHASHLWQAMRSSNDITYTPGSEWRGYSWILNLSDQLEAEDRVIFLMMLWRIWHVRNELFHGKPAVPANVSQRFISSYISSLLEIKQHPHANPSKGKHIVQHRRPARPPSPPKPSPGIFSWVKPPTGWMKLSIDGSFVSKEKPEGIGAVLRNYEGKLIFAACGVLHSCGSALEAELMTCKEGLIMALQWTLLPIIVVTDCVEILSMIHPKKDVRSELAFTVREVVNLLSGSREIVINKVHRDQVRDSHMLANKGRNELLSAF